MRTARKFTAMAAGLAVASLALAACSSGSGSDDETGGTGSGDEVEVFTWWASGSEKLGLDALVGVFETQNPDVAFVNGAVAGGAGSAAKDLLQSRLQANDPPDTFQAHAGAELTDYINAGQVEDVSALYDEFGLRDAFPADLVERLTVDGKIYSIPSNIHRANVVWANTQLLTDSGLDPAATYASLDDWFVALDAVKEKTGRTPLSVATTWTQVNLFETILLSDLGADGYNGLWDGSTDWASPEVTDALADFEKLMSYTNEDRDGLDWPDATQQVIDGNAAFNVMGDWAVAAFEEAGKKAPADYVYMPVPGTDGVFDFLADSFTLPVGAPHPAGAKAWLKTIGSLDGQVAFNKAKGSIPARNDAKPEDFSEYQQSAMTSFGQDTIVSSLAHGAAAPAAWANAISDATSKFTTGGGDLAGFQADLVAAAEANAG
ncbi:ABC transporter substrate-binding protein [Cellulomonas sp. Root137]|uniref:ABC transporter substrate-binding protein n=1 Tax=Cellulomonas sp. Root137 TaxID=1736459 RepID=UPI000701B2B7|nr:ABC transporter substrate-binding protein [Cellulomonas sp. Root137]KQY47362.1 sugar ABC transporter substrate-binding protein [Cellulomonas sp. Root137]KRD44502.1 sugar ABC transporter substrate-binding protein [Cellulomonas sp. Root930]